MIFAQMQYQEHYDDVHDELLALLAAHFLDVEEGHQGDSYVWILDGEKKVAIDTFTSMKHQIKSPKGGPHVQKVIDTLRLKYSVNVYEIPEFECHEDPPAA